MLHYECETEIHSRLGFVPVKMPILFCGSVAMVLSLRWWSCIFSIGTTGWHALPQVGIWAVSLVWWCPSDTHYGRPGVWPVLEGAGSMIPRDPISSKVAHVSSLIGHDILIFSSSAQSKRLRIRLYPSLAQSRSRAWRRAPPNLRWSSHAYRRHLARLGSNQF